ncbi:MAG TPA: tetratricopeptide repeat protein [Gemmatimonadaceae bacterium]|nr:tetratricopeptide repeat protein [Gemmatimonadaceae bacterium]
MSLCALAGAGAGGCGQVPTPASGDALFGSPTDVEAVSLLGGPLRRPELPAATRDLYELRLSEARRAWERAPGNADSIIWLGRRTAYLGRYREAISIFTDGIAKHPNDPRMYRHRGHRYLSVRQLDRAIADLSRAGELVRGRPDQVEPDGIPNAGNTPTSTLQSNVWYHLGLAHYLKGDFRHALSAYHEAMRVSTNPDMLVATSHWLYMTLRRLGRASEAELVLAPITPEMPIIENAAYHRLLLLYKGMLPADSLAPAGRDALTDATTGYGVGNWHLYNGRRDSAVQVFRRVVSGGSWASFGYIAAEAELARGR